MKDIEAKINSEIYKFKKLSNIINCIAVILIIIFLLSFFNVFLKHEVAFGVFSYFFIAVFLVVGKIIYKNKVFKQIKEEIFEKILPKLLVDNKLIYNAIGINKKEFIDSGLYNNFTEYYTSDGIKAISNNIYMANVMAIRKEENRKTTVFSGIFGYMKTEDFCENEIIIKPDVENKYVRDILDEKEKILGAFNNTVRLENNEFEKYFEVYSKDRVKARQVVTPSYMENLVEIRNDIKAPIKIIYLGDKKYIAIWNMRIIDEKEIYKNGVSIDKIKEKFDKLFELFKKC